MTEKGGGVAERWRNDEEREREEKGVDAPPLATPSPMLPSLHSAFFSCSIYIRFTYHECVSYLSINLSFFVTEKMNAHPLG